MARLLRRSTSSDLGVAGKASSACLLVISAEKSEDLIVDSSRGADERLGGGEPLAGRRLDEFFAGDDLGVEALAREPVATLQIKGASETVSFAVDPIGPNRLILSQVEDPKSEDGRKDAETSASKARVAEAELLKLQTQLEFVFSGAREGYWDWRSETGVVHISHHWATILGFDPAKAKALDTPRDELLRIMHPDDRDLARAEMEAHLSGAIDNFVLEVRIRGRKGWRWMLARGQAVARDERDAPTRIVGTYSDVTERKRSEARLVESERRFRDLFHGAYAGHCIHKHFKPILLNDAFAEIHGYGGVEELLALPDLLPLMPEQVQQDPQAAWKRLVYGFGGEGKKRLAHRRRDGSPVFVDVFSRVVEWDDDDAVFLTLVDVTAEVARENDLMRAREEAIAAARAKSSFLATMSHEIRTPMNSVLGMSELLLDTQLTEEQRKYIEVSQTSGKHLMRLLNDILDLTKLESGKVEFERRPIRLRDEVEAVCQILRPNSEAKEIELKTETPEAAGRKLLGDDGRIRQVLFNLVSNAVKFTERGSVTVRAVELDRDDSVKRSVWRFEIEDTGVGIEQGAVDKLFREFSQEDASTTRRFGGTGLGLAICKRIVDLMGGEIGVKSEKGRGSLFWFEAPFDDAAEDAEVERTADAPTDLEHEPAHILIAEDNPANQLLIRTLLEKRGHTVEMVDNGRKAVDLVRKGGFDVILMDVQMPEMDGATAARTIKNLLGDSSPPIIAVTANAMRGDRERFLSEGMDDYVTKPLEPKKIFTAVNRWATEGRRRRAAPLTA